MNRSLKLLTLFLISFLMIFSCSILNEQNTEKKVTIPSAENKVFIDVGNGKTGGTFEFKINHSEGFKLKNNINGWDAKYASIDHYKLALVTTAGTGSNALTTLPLGTSADVYTISKASLTAPSASATHIFFKNVPNGAYYVAIAAYDADNRNVTLVTGTTGTISVASGDNFAVSTAGGDAGNTGLVTVSATYTVPTNPVTIPLTLSTAFGADIEVEVTVTQNTNLLSAINAFRFYLVSTNTGNLVDANITGGPFDLTTGTKFSTLKTIASGNIGTMQKLIFKSVPAGTYYVAGAAYNSSGTINSTTNITSDTHNITITTTPVPTGNMGLFSISTTGGTSGSVVVTSTYGITTPAVILPIQLL